MADLLSTDQTDIAFVKEESPAGTLIVPAGTDALRLIGEMDGAQDPSLFESLERFPSRSVLEYFKSRYEPGDFAAPFYMKRTGVVDTAVGAIDTLLTCGLGIKTTNAGTNIKYTLATIATTLKTFSQFFQSGYMTFQRAGCILNDFSWPFQATPDEAAQFRCNASGMFAREYWAGYTVSTEANVTTDAALDKVKVAVADLAPYDHATVADIAGKFTKGAYVMHGALTTSHKIIAINPTTGVIQVTPAFGSSQATGSVLKGYMPTATDSGQPISGHKGFFVFDGANWIMLSGTIHATMGLSINNDQKNDSDYPEAIPQPNDKRRIKIEGVRALWNPTPTVGKASDLFKAMADRVDDAAGAVNIGNTAGYIWDFDFPKLLVRNPRIASDGGRKILTCDMECLATSSLDNELNLESR